MGITRSILNAISGQDIDPAKVTTDDLDVGTADFVASGEFFPLATFGPIASRTLSTTSTTYTSTISQLNHNLNYADLLPDDVQIQAVFTTNVVVGTDETVDIRLYEAYEPKAVVEKTGITSDGFHSLGPVDYNPATRDTRHQLRAQVRTNPGTNSCRLDEPTAIFGVGL